MNHIETKLAKLRKDMLELKILIEVLVKFLRERSPLFPQKLLIIIILKIKNQ